MFRALCQLFRPAGRNTSHAALMEALEPRELLSAAPIGWVDVYSRSTISGWAYAAGEGANPVQIDIEINGAVTTITADGQRNDLIPVVGSRYHGFTFTVPTLAPGVDTVDVYARDSDGTRTLLRGGTLTNPAPVGWIDSINSTGISGWTVDTDAPTQALQIRVDVDGITGTPQAASLTRNDLTPIYGSANHGFFVAGNFTGHVVDIYAQDAPSGQWVLLKSTGHAPIGYVDSMNQSSVSGWAFDSDLGSGPTEIRVDVDGVAGTPVNAALARGDLTSVVGSPNHGFVFTLPTLSPGEHTIAVYAIDTASTSVAPVLIGQGTVTNMPPRGYVDVLNSSVVSGWAFDPDAGASPINITVYVDEVVFATVSANLYRGDLVAAIGSGNHGFSVNLSSLSSGAHAITITMHDSAGGSNDEVVLFDGFINHHDPIGYVDAANSRSVSGWAFDLDVGAAAVAVDVYIDGAYALTGTANLTRNDLTAVVGSPNHGFSISLPSMSFGAHKIDVYAATAQSTVSTLIGSVNIVNPVPVGYLDVFNGTTISGWALDTDWGADPMTAELFVDGVESQSVTANSPRNDLVAIFGSANHGFTISVPGLSAGNHELSVFIVDPNNSILVPLGTRSITV